ncbi:MAG: hypothetical protein ABI036_09210 [Fibrobacteria bacterium]
MDTKSPLNAQTRNRSIGGARASLPRPSPLPFLGRPADSAQGGKSPDWQASGLVDQMLAYRDWWNLPARRPLPHTKTR